MTNDEEYAIEHLVWLIYRDNVVVSVAKTEGLANAWIAYRVQTSSERDKRGEKKRYTMKRWVVIGE